MNRKEGRLSARWDKHEDDILFSFPRNCDGALLHYHFNVLRTHEIPGLSPEGKSLVEELEARGYDIKTLRLTIDRKASGDVLP